MGLTNFILTCEKDNEELRKDINYYKNTVSRLKKENQELRDKISDMQESYETDAEAKFYDYLGKHESKSDKETQQKEFIKYLEDEIEECFRSGDCRELKTFQNILQKYKSITGEKNESR